MGTQKNAKKKTFVAKDHSMQKKGEIAKISSLLEYGEK